MFTLLKKIVDRPLDRWFATSRLRPGRVAAPLQRWFRPMLDALEDRVVPSATVLPHNSATIAAVALSSTSVPPVVTGATATGPTSGSLSSIQVTFSQPIVPATFTPADLSLLGPDGRVTITSVTPLQGKNDESFTVAFAKQTAVGTYTLYVGSDARNSAGISVTDYHTAFKIAAPTVTPTAPVVTSATASGPTSNSLSSIEVTFSQPIVPSTFTAADVGLLGPNGLVAIASVTPVSGTNDESFIIAFAQQTAAGTYTLAVGSAAKNSAGTSVTNYQKAFTIAPATSTPQSSSTFTGTLLPGQFITSSNGQFALTLLSNGNLVEYNAAGTPLWSSGTSGKTVTDMMMQGDGNLVLYDGTTAVWSTNTAGNPGATLSVQNNGTLVILRGAVPIWTSTGSQQFVLLPGQAITSPNGQFILVLQGDGNLVEYDSSWVPVWMSGTSGRAVTEMVMQSDGNLVLYDGVTPVWATNTPGSPGAYLNLQNNGNIEIDTGTTPIWSPGLSLMANGFLLPGQSIPSPDGQFTLTLQNDGNLVEYNTSGAAVWSSGTYGKAVTELAMQSDGNLVLYDGATPIWSSSTAGNPGAYLTVQNGGNIVIDSGATPIWSG